MESDGWAVQLEKYKARVQQLEIELEQSVKREEQAAKLTSRLLEALNQISQEEDSNKQFVAEVEQLVMQRVDGALRRMSRPTWQNNQQLTTRGDEWQTKPVTHQRASKENRDSTNHKPISMDKAQLRSMTAKLLRVRNGREPMNWKE